MGREVGEEKGEAVVGEAPAVLWGRRVGSWEGGGAAEGGGVKAVRGGFLATVGGDPAFGLLIYWFLFGEQ